MQGVVLAECFIDIDGEDIAQSTGSGSGSGSERTRSLLSSGTMVLEVEYSRELASAGKIKSSDILLCSHEVCFSAVLCSVVFCGVVFRGVVLCGVVWCEALIQYFRRKYDD